MQWERAIVLERHSPSKETNMARPQKPADAELIGDLAGIGCTMKEIAILTDLSEDTLNRRFAGVIEKGRENSRSSLRRMQYKAAEAGNITMMIWLGKQMLGQKDKTEHSGDDEKPFKLLVEHVSPPSE